MHTELFPYFCGPWSEWSSEYIEFLKVLRLQGLGAHEAYELNIFGLLALTLLQNPVGLCAVLNIALL